MEKQTAVEILVSAIFKRFGYANCGDMIDEINQAKAIEKQQIVEAYATGLSVNFFNGVSNQVKKVADKYFESTYKTNL